MHLWQTVNPHFLLKSSKLTILVLAQNSSSPMGKLLVTLPDLPLLYQDTQRWSSQAVHFNSWGLKIIDSKPWVLWGYILVFGGTHISEN